MPLTVSHAAAVLPLKNTRLPLAALMIGSMSPDFAYFLPAGQVFLARHNLRGILVFCLPVGLLVWLLFVRVLERPTIELLPEAWRVRVPRSDTQLTLRALCVAGVAVVLGAVTHVAWDALTHGNTAITNAFPVLQAEMFELQGRPVRVYYLLQCLCSVLGLLALALWARNLRRGAPCEPSDSMTPLSNRTRVLAVATMMTTSGVMALLSVASYSGTHLEHRVFQLLIGSMVGWVLGWLAIAVWITLRSANVTTAWRIIRRLSRLILVRTEIAVQVATGIALALSNHARRTFTRLGRVAASGLAGARDAAPGRNRTELQGAPVAVDGSFDLVGSKARATTVSRRAENRHVQHVPEVDQRALPFDRAGIDV